VLTSILCTAKQQDKDVFALLVDLLRSAEPKLRDILPPEVRVNRPGSQAYSEEDPGIRKSSDSPQPFPFLSPPDGSVILHTATPPIFNST
jgi:hypothetical protein